MSQEQMKKRMEELRRENDDIARRRTERDEEKADGILGFLRGKFPERDDREHLTFWSRSLRRRGGSGQPRSRIYAEKMKIPRKR